MNKIDNIKNLWGQIGNKTDFIKEFAPVVGRSPSTLHNHWFARFWTVPIEFQDQTIKYMQNYIRNKTK